MFIEALEVGKFFLSIKFVIPKRNYMSTYLKLLVLLFIATSLQAQVGISTTSPQAALDVNTSNSGVLIPRVTLVSETDVTTVTSPNAPNIIESTMVYHTGSVGLVDAGFYFWNGTSWVKLVDNTPSVWVGKQIISATGDIDIALPFKPARVVFTAYANVDAFVLNDDNSSGSDNNNTKENTFGSMKGYAHFDGTSIMQQVIFNGGSGNSINDISRYASSAHCIGLRYTNSNGGNLGLTNAFVDSFTDTGFTLTVSNATDAVLVIYEAYRY